MSFFGILRRRTTEEYYYAKEPETRDMLRKKMEAIDTIGKELYSIANNKN
jgi:hypothetical protein